jgi:hypothetical protein
MCSRLESSFIAMLKSLNINNKNSEKEIKLTVEIFDARVYSKNFNLKFGRVFDLKNLQTICEIFSKQCFLKK